MYIEVVHLCGRASRSALPKSVSVTAHTATGNVVLCVDGTFDGTTTKWPIIRLEQRPRRRLSFRLTCAIVAAAASVIGEWAWMVGAFQRVQ